MTFYATVKITCVDHGDEKYDYVGVITIPLKDIHHGAEKEVVEKWYPLQPVKGKDEKQKVARKIVQAKNKLAQKLESMNGITFFSLSLLFFVCLFVCFFISIRKLIDISLFTDETDQKLTNVKRNSFSLPLFFRYTT